MATHIPDQVDLLVQADKAAKEIASSTTSLRAAGMEVPPMPKLTADHDLIQDGELLDAHVAKLRVLGKLTPTAEDKAKAGNKPMSLDALCRAVNAGTMTVREALQAKQKPEQVTLTKLSRRGI